MLEKKVFFLNCHLVNVNVPCIVTTGLVEASVFSFIQHYILVEIQCVSVWREFPSHKGGVRRKRTDMIIRIQENRCFMLC